MPRTRAHASTAVVLSSAPAPEALITAEFKHQLSHSANKVAQALVHTHKAALYGLTTPPGSATPQAIVNRAQRELIASFRLQTQHRRQHHENRQNAANSLSAFEPSVARLPLPALSEDSCCKPTGPTRQAEQGSEMGCSHEHGQGGIVLDLDEAVHGMYASVKYLSQAAQGKPEEVKETFVEQAEALSTRPLQYSGEEVTEGGVGEFTAAVGTGALMMPLAGLAVKAGIKEYKSAQLNLRRLKQQRADVLGQMQRTQQVAQAGLMENTVVRSLGLAVTQDRLNTAIHQTRRDRSIGLASAGSGLAIGLKAVSDIALKCGLGVKGAFSGKGFFSIAETTQASVAATGASVALGLMGTLVLSPVAGACATLLGVLFAKKSSSKAKQLKQDFSALKVDLNNDKLQQLAQGENTHNALYDFLIRQGEKRTGFFKRFAKWNRAFAVGSGLYAASATTKAIVTGLAIGGVGAAASNPIGLGVILGVGLVGALIMGVASLSFIRGHGKQSKYQRHSASQHRWTDRALLAQQHAINKVPTEAGHELNPEQHASRRSAFDLASATLEQLDSRKQALRHFMVEAATHIGKKPLLSKALTWRDHLSGSVVNNKDIQKYVSSETGHQALKRLVQSILKADFEQLKKQIAVRLDGNSTLTSAGEPVSENIPEGEDALSRVQAIASVMADLDAELERDQNSMEVTLLNLKRLEAGELNTEALLGLLDEHGKGTLKKAAKTLLRLDISIRNARGTLFESQLDGIQLKGKQLSQLATTLSPSLHAENTAVQNQNS